VDTILLQDFARIDAPGRQRIVFRYALQLTDDGNSLDKAVTAPVELGLSIDVLPPDLAALGRVIDGYGRAMDLGRDDPRGGRIALWALTRIDDARVVPWLADAATTGTYSQKFVALGRLPAFDEERGLKAMIQELADADENIQARAAYALSQSKDARALATLWDARKSKSEAVRLTLVHALGARRDATSTSRLGTMSGDASTMVSSEAKRYLAERGKSP
jgi:hypothetical protein